MNLLLLLVGLMEEPSLWSTCREGSSSFTSAGGLALLDCDLEARWRVVADSPLADVQRPNAGRLSITLGLLLVPVGVLGLTLQVEDQYEVVHAIGSRPSSESGWGWSWPEWLWLERLRPCEPSLPPCTSAS